MSGCRAVNIAARLWPPDEFLDSEAFVAGEVVHVDDIAWRECGREAFFHPLLKRGGEAGDERDRLVVTARNGGAQSSTASAASAFARQICERPGFVDEQQLRRIEIQLPGEPLPALFQDFRALLLLGVRGLFLKVIA
jgi:hypothetical protein